MFSRKFSNTIRKRKRLILSSLLLLFIILGLGYSAFTSDFSITGSLSVSGYVEPTLYNVLKSEAESNGLAKIYTDNHEDSMDSNKIVDDIYYWYAEDSNEGNQILNKSNVIFANQCFQMVRTTDTGGVKMVYNGEAVGGKCLNTRGNHVGYVSSEISDLSSNYWYGDDYTYDSLNNVFSISGTTSQAVWNSTSSADLIGKYTCKSVSVSGTCQTLEYVSKYVDNNNALVLLIDDNSHYSQFGTLEFDKDNFSIANVGYMSNQKYYNDHVSFDIEEVIYYDKTISLNFWYATTYDYGNLVPGDYSLISPYQITSEADYPNLVGKYTFFEDDSTVTHSGIYYIAGVNDGKLLCIRLTSGSPLSNFNDSYVFGDSYTDNGNGTYTINNGVSFNKTDWINTYSSVKKKYGCKSPNGNICNDLWYIADVEDNEFHYEDTSVFMKFAGDFTYSNGTYTLNNNQISLWDVSISTNKHSIDNAHYTCLDNTGQCNTLAYVYYVNGTDIYYVNLTGGKDVDDIVDEMLYDNNVNTNDSLIKSGIDAWYKKYLSTYASYIDDTIYCAQRVQTNSNDNGWNKSGGSVTKYMYFTTQFTCQNDLDKFSVSNNKAKLKYPVGLMTYDELNMANDTTFRTTGEVYWTMSPNGIYYDYAGVWTIKADGSTDARSINRERGVRPAISLVKGTTYSSGDGSMNNPYVVSTS